MNGKNKMGFSRRNLLKFGAGAAGTGVLTGLGSNLISPKRVAAKDDVTPDQALQALMDGNERFIKKKRQPINYYERLAAVSKTQKPFAALLGCADSRVPAEIVFDQGFGDLFVCRVAGNIATPEEIGSLEFGSAVLGAKLIMVLGHKRCGAVEATLKGAQVPGQIGSLLAAIKPAVEETKGQAGDRLENTCKANILLQAKKLQASPVITQLIKEDKLKVVGGYYDLDTGKVTLVG